MSKQTVSSINNLADLGTIATGTAEPRFPRPVESSKNKAPRKSVVCKLRESGLAIMREAQAVMQEVKDVCHDIAERVADIGDALKNEGSALFMTRIIDEEKMLVGVINDSDVSDELKREMARTLIISACEHFPHDSQSLNHIAMMGLRISFLRPVNVNTGIRMPVTQDDGKWKGEHLAPVHGEEEALNAIRQFASEVDAISRRESELLKKELYKDAMPPLEAMEQGGVATMYCPSNPKDRRERSGDIRFKVDLERNIIFPIAAVGNISGSVETLAETQTGLTIDQIGAEKINPGERLPRDVFYALITFQHAFARGLQKAERDKGLQEENDKLGTMGTISEQEFFSSEKPGMVALQFPYWRVGDKKYGNVFLVVERNDQGEVRVVACQESRRQLFENCMAFADPDEAAFPLKQMMQVRFNQIVQQKQKDDELGTTEELDQMASMPEVEPLIEKKPRREPKPRRTKKS